MLRIGCLCLGSLLMLACSDDGHVVGEMGTEAGGAATITATSAGGTTSGSGGGVTAATTGTSSGGSSTGGTATDTTAQASTATGGSGGATNSGGNAGVSNSGGSAGADASSGGSSGSAGETSTSTGSTDPCPPGQIWCPGCTPGEGICSVGGCPGVACAECEYIETLEECEITYGCHAVFEDPNTCGCAAIGCCARFKSCAIGSQADCEGPANCEALTPFCDDPAYVVSYANGCFEGCVRPETCAE